MKISFHKIKLKLRKEVQKVKKARMEGKWALIRNRNAVVWDMNQKIITNSNSTHSESFHGTVGVFHGTKALS